MADRNTTPLFRKQLVETYGTKCKICGEDGAEYHHLIPLWKGGEDVIENFVPLCRWHHMLLHNANARPRWKCKNSGRSRKIANTSGYKYILDDYLHCKIGTKECKESLGMTKSTALSDRKWFREYVKECGIKAYKNNIDVLRSQDKRLHGNHYTQKQEVGWIEYEDGRKEVFDSTALRIPL